MAILVISKNTIDLDSAKSKNPGIRLVEALREFGVFSLLDVPSYFYKKTIMGRLTILGIYIKSAAKIFRRRNEEIFFYNFSPAYVLLYILSFFFRLHRPSLYLLDGVNCLGIKYNERLFIKLFRRVISASFNDTVYSEFQDAKKIIWYPGCFKLVNNNLKRSSRIAGRIKLLYNSSFLPYNSPESMLRLASENDWLEVIVTDTEDNFIHYLKNNRIKIKLIFPVNLKFIGPLQFDKYIKLTEEVDGILLSRDESMFENKYNFPSKFIEALKLKIPFFSLFPISAVPSTLYYLIKPDHFSESDILNYVQRYSCGAFELEETEFLSKCDPDRLKKWIAVSC